jgi:hypothetical protein
MAQFVLSDWENGNRVSHCRKVERVIEKMFHKMLAGLVQVDFSLSVERRVRGICCRKVERTSEKVPHGLLALVSST